MWISTINGILTKKVKVSKKNATVLFVEDTLEETKRTCLVYVEDAYLVNDEALVPGKCIIAHGEAVLASTADPERKDMLNDLGISTDQPEYAKLSGSKTLRINAFTVCAPETVAPAELVTPSTPDVTNNSDESNNDSDELPIAGVFNKRD